MHLNTKKIAFAGVMLALTEVGIALGSVIETNTLFLLAAASVFSYSLSSPFQSNQNGRSLSGPVSSSRSWAAPFDLALCFAALPTST